QVQQDAAAAVEVAAETIRAPVGCSGKELMEEMAMPGGDLDTGESGLAKHACAACELHDQLFGLGGGQRPRHRPAEIVGERRRRDGRLVAPGAVAAAAGILHL